MDTESKNDDTNKFLVQNTETEEMNNETEISDSNTVDSIDEQNKIDVSALNSRNDKNFNQCSSAGDIYSEDELNE
jgi:hypothetical protein